MLHILIFTLACIIVAYACIAFRDDPHVIDPWEGLFRQRDSQITRHVSPRQARALNLSERSSARLDRDQNGAGDSPKTRVANSERRPFVKVAL